MRERTRRSPDHRRRRIRRGVRVAHRRDGHQRPLPGARSVDAPARLSQQLHGLGVAWHGRRSRRAQMSASLPADYPVNEQDSAISPLMFNAVGGSTILWAAHFPRFTPRDFRVKSDDGVADDWPIDYETLEPFYRHQRPHDGRLGPARATPPTRTTSRRCRRLPLGRVRERARSRLREARLALVAVRQRHHVARVRGPRAVHQPRLMHQRLRPGREGQHGHHVLARRAAQGRGAPHRAAA